MALMGSSVCQGAAFDWKEFDLVKCGIAASILIGACVEWRYKKFLSRFASDGFSADLGYYTVLQSGEVSQCDARMRAWTRLPGIGLRGDGRWKHRQQRST